MDFVEELGATQLFHGKVAGAEFIVQASTGQLAADTRRLTLSIDADNVHLFDAQTSKRLGRNRSVGAPLIVIPGRALREPRAINADGSADARTRCFVAWGERL